MSRSELLERLVDDYGYDRHELVHRTTAELDRLYRFHVDEEVYDAIYWND